VLAQEEVTVDPQDSFFSLYRRCGVVGARLLAGVLSGAHVAGAARTAHDGQASYFSFVTPQAVRKFRKRGRHFFSRACLDADARLLRDPRGWNDRRLAEG
jgi:methionyl-tRNA formyltransferase